MATAAFKSTTKRTSIGSEDSTSTTSTTRSACASNLRRSRSISRFSHRLPPSEETLTTPARRGKFVNTVRGSEYPEISLDDLAIEMFSSSEFGGERGRSSAETTSSQRRGRSVSRREEMRSGGGSGGGRVVSDGSLRSRRSLSVVPKYNQLSDSESDCFQKIANHTNTERFSNGYKQKSLGQKAAGANQQKGLRRCSSQKDLFKSYDGYSSYSSVLTDDETRDDCYDASKMGRVRTVHPQKKHPTVNNGSNSVYEAMRKELRHAVQEIKLQTEQVKSQPSDLTDNGDCDVLEAVSTMRRNYAAKLEQSEKHKHELLAQIMLEEERGKQLKKIVSELHPHSKQASAGRRLSRGRKRSNERTRTTKKLAEEAEKIIEEFISSVEETDISSIDGERSDSSSTLGGITRPPMWHGETEPLKRTARCDSNPVEMDGVVLPWLLWETSNENDSTPLICRDSKQPPPPTPKTLPWDSPQEMTVAKEQEQSIRSRSSCGSWSAGFADSNSLDTRGTSQARESEGCRSRLLAQVPRKSHVDVYEYIRSPSNEEVLYERWMQRHSISSGCLLMCERDYFGTILL